MGSRHTINHVVVVEVQKVLPLFSPAYDTMTTEQEILDRWVSYWNEVNAKR